MLKSSLCDYSDEAQGQPNNRANKKVIIKNCAPFTKCISRIKSTLIDDVRDIHVVMALYNLTEYANTRSFNLKLKLTSQKGNDGTHKS